MLLQFCTLSSQHLIKSAHQVSLSLYSYLLAVQAENWCLWVPLHSLVVVNGSGSKVRDVAFATSLTPLNHLCGCQTCKGVTWADRILESHLQVPRAAKADPCLSDTAAKLSNIPSSGCTCWGDMIKDPKAELTPFLISSSTPRRKKMRMS